MKLNQNSRSGGTGNGEKHETKEQNIDMNSSLINVKFMFIIELLSVQSLWLMSSGKGSEGTIVCNWDQRCMVYGLGFDGLGVKKSEYQYIGGIGKDLL